MDFGTHNITDTSNNICSAYHWADENVPHVVQSGVDKYDVMVNVMDT